MKNIAFLLVLAILFLFTTNLHAFDSEEGVTVQVIFPKNGSNALLIDFDNANKDLYYQIPSSKSVIKITVADKNKQVLFSTVISEDFTVFPDLLPGEYTLLVEIDTKVYKETVLF